MNREPNAPHEFTLEELQDLLQKPEEMTTEVFPQVAPKSTAAGPEKSVGRFTSLVVNQDWVSGSAARFFADAGIEFDPSFEVDQIPKQEFEWMTEGLDEETKVRISAMSRSRTHFYHLVDIANESKQADEELAGYGAWGVAGRFGANVLDPSNYLLAAATGGAGVLTKAERLRKTALAAATATERAGAAASLQTMAKAGHAGKVLSTATGAALENAGIQLADNATNANRDGWDVAYAGLAAFGAGSAFGRLSSGSERATLRRMEIKTRNELGVLELKQELAGRRASLLSELGDVNAANAAESAVARQAGSFVAGRDADMSGYAAFATALESGGNASAKAPTSSATGLHQFIGSTWLGYVRKLQPAWAKGKTEEEVLALRMDPAKSAEVFNAYTADNVAALRKADAPVNPFTVYAAHHFGPGKGVTFAKASDETPMTSILSEAQLEANPYLRGLTKAEAIANWSGRARRKGVDMGALVTNIPADGAEGRRIARLDGFDRGTAERRLAEIEAEDAEVAAAARATRAAQSEGSPKAPKPSPSPLIKMIEMVPVRAAAKREAEQLFEALGMRGQQDADDTARRNLGDVLRASEPRLRNLRQLDALDNVDAANEARSQALKAGTAVQPFAQDTLSAAKAIGIDTGLHPGLADAVDRASAPKMNLAGALKFGGHGTFAGVLRGSDHAIVRQELGPLVGNALGNADGSAVSAGASEIASMLSKRQAGKWSANVEPAFDAWAKERELGAWSRYNRSVRADFMRDVGLYVRGADVTDPHVKAAGDRLKTLFADVLKEAKEAGVKGFDNVEAKDNWLPRVFNFHALYALRTRYGSDQLETLIAKSMQQIRPELEDKIANRVAKAYIHRLSELRMGNDAGLMQGMSFDDIGFLRQFLGEAQVPSEELEEIVAKFAAAKIGDKPVMNGEGSFRHAKARAQLDETFAMDLRDAKLNDGTMGRVTVSDLFENNVETLFGRYSRTMAGHTALAKIGIKSRADFAERIRKVAHAMEGSAEWKQVETRANAAYALITGRPLQDSNVYTELARASRDFAFASQMENAGLSNVPDMASLLAWGNFRYTAKAFFNGDVFGAMWKRNSEGRMSDELMREIEETTGLGTDFLNNQVHASYDVADDYAEALVDGNWFTRNASSVASGAAYGARVVGRAVTAGSGLAAVTSLAQRMAARNIVYRLKDELFKGGRFSEARMTRLGIDEAMRKRIEEQMRKHTEWTKGETGGDIQRVNFVAWDDLEARDAFLYAVHREARKNVQEEDLGDTFMFQHRAIGKVLSQFRRFGITAYTKQTLRAVSERDAEAATRALLQMTLAAGVWQARNELIALGMEASGTDPEKVAQFRREKLSGKALMAAAIRNSGVAALFPDLSDTATGWTVGERFFDVRNSGNSSDLLAGIPAVAWWSNLGKAAGSTVQAAIRGDRQFDRRDAKAWQALVPFGNHLLVAPAIEAMVADLPAGDEDENPSEPKWAWE